MKLEPVELGILGERLEFDAEVAPDEVTFAAICRQEIHRKEFIVDDNEYELVIKTAWGCRQARHNNELSPAMAKAIATIVLEG